MLANSQLFNRLGRNKFQKMLGQLVFESIEKNRDMPAVNYKNKFYFYHELLSDIKSIDNFLNEHKIISDDIVAVVLDKSYQSIVFILALFIRNNCIVPLDITMPISRQQTMVSISNAKYVISCKEINFSNVKNLRYRRDNFKKNISELKYHNSKKGNDRVSAIYFTSGSTAEPKAVLMTDEAISHYVEWHANNFFKDKNLRVAQLASLSFDASLKDILPTIISGSCLMLPPTNSPYQDLAEMIDWIEQYKVNILQTVPSVIEALCDTVQDNTNYFSNIKKVCLAGESLTKNICEKWQKTFSSSNADIYNLYGATETCILKSSKLINITQNSNLITIGNPITGCEIVVLDPRGEKCRPKVIGEISILTPYRLPGYLNADNSRFIYHEKNGNTMTLYKTGDKGRYDIKGEITVLGRLDREVKINGVRVNPVEIESIINSFKNIERSIVVIKDIKNKKTLIAYVKSNQSELDIESLNKYLGERLISSSIPTIFVSIDRIPLNQNGKLSYEKLPEFTYFSKPVYPKNKIEIKVFEFWKESLRNEINSVETDFYQLGASSLDIARILMKINAYYKININLTDLIKCKTIRLQSLLIENTLKNSKFLNIRLNLKDKPSGSRISPLSAQQSRLYYLNELGNGSPDYNMIGSYEINGKLEIDRFKHVFNKLIMKHDSLRTQFKKVNDVPMQFVVNNVDFSLEFHDLSFYEHNKKIKLINKYLTMASNIIFNLSVAPLMRMFLLKLSKQKHILIYVIHHIIGDGWSGNILMKDISAYWNGLPENEDYYGVNYSYIDYVYAQNDFQESEYYQQQFNFWKDKIKEMPVNNRLKIIHGNNYNNANMGNNYSYDLKPNEIGIVNKICIDYQCTAYILLLSIFSSVLLRRSGVKKITLGTDLLGRDTDELAEIVGFFVNTVPLNITVNSKYSFLDIINRVRKEYESIQNNPDVQFDKIVSLFGRESVSNDNPLFNIMFRFWDSSKIFSLSGLKVKSYKHSISKSKFDLTLALIKTIQGYSFEYEYDAGLYKKEDIKTLNQQLIKMLNSVADNIKINFMRPYLGIHCEYLSQLKPINFEEYSDNLVDILKQNNINNQSEVSIYDKSERVTYEELFKEVHSVANQLQNIGLDKHSIVAIISTNSLEAIVMMMACVQVCYVYILIDEQIPVLRQKKMIEAVETTAVITTVDILDQIIQPIVNYSYRFKSRLLLIKPSINIKNIFEKKKYRGKPFCIFYTSGSTGEPKPIVYPVESLIQFITWQNKQFKIKKGSRFAQLTTISFDAILRDVFLPLFSKGKIIIPNKEIKQDTGRLLTWLDGNEIDIIHTVPSVVNNWLKFSTSNTLKSLKYLFLSGEPILQNMIISFKKVFQDSKTKIVNFYGPSETMMIKTFHVVDYKQDLASIPAGKPITGCDVYILNEKKQLVSRYEIGEIYIRSLYGTLGYYHAANNNSYVKNPLFKDKTLLYKTGDIGTIDKNNNIIIIGRKDNQIKINGIRINVEEIRKAFLGHPNVVDGHIIIDYKSTEIQLIGFYVTDNGQILNDQEHKDNLSLFLSESFHPKKYIHLSDFPKLANGKINYKKLFDLYYENNKCNKSLLGKVENTKSLNQVISIFEELLGKSDLNANDNFFRIGGHSLLATLLVTKIRQAFDIEYSLREILINPTPISIANNIDKKINKMVIEN